MGIVRPKDKTLHPTRSESFSFSVQYNTLRLAPKLFINTFTLRSLLKLTPRTHTCPLCNDIAYTAQCAGPLARCQCSEGPETDHLDTGFLSWFPCVLKANAEVFPKYPRCHYILLM